MRDCEVCGKKITEDRLVAVPNARLCLECQKLEEVEAGAKFPMCPICGEDMILRHGPYGQFYGCSRYPRCKGTRNI